MFNTVSGEFNTVVIALAGLGVSAVALGFVSLGLMNVFSIFDPRMGAQIKIGLIKMIISGVFLGSGAAIIELSRAIAAGA